MSIQSTCRTLAARDAIENTVKPCLTFQFLEAFWQAS